MASSEPTVSLVPAASRRRRWRRANAAIETHSAAKPAITQPRLDCLNEATPLAMVARSAYRAIADPAMIAAIAAALTVAQSRRRREETAEGRWPDTAVTVSPEGLRRRRAPSPGDGSGPDPRPGARGSRIPR